MKHNGSLRFALLGQSVEQRVPLSENVPPGSLRKARNINRQFLRSSSKGVSSRPPEVLLILIQLVLTSCVSGKASGSTVTLEQNQLLPGDE